MNRGAEISAATRARAIAAGLAAVAAQAANAVPSHAVLLSVRRSGEEVIASVSGRSERPLPVEFHLSVEGPSSVRHAGRGVLGSAAKLLSVARFQNRPPWRVELDVEEDGKSYTIVCTDAVPNCFSGT